MKTLASLILHLSILMSLCSCTGTYKPVPPEPLEMDFVSCDAMKRNVSGHDYYEIAEIWGPPSDSGTVYQPDAKHGGAYGEYTQTYMWSDTSRVKVEGKHTIALHFEMMMDSLTGTFYPKVGDSPDGTSNCYPLH